jgi:quinol monooxygenase YgiN
MSKIGLLVRIEAKPEYAGQVENLLRSAQQLADQEQGTVTWFAFRRSATVFGVFDTFEDEQGRMAHLQGQIAAALGEIAQTALASAPAISEVDLLGVKIP